MSAASTLPAQLPIVPFTRPVSGPVVIPGSKSLTNRALLLAALCDRPVTLIGALFSDDTRLMAEALRRLGCTVTEDETACTIAVTGQGNAFKSDAPVDICVGLAGTAARFLTALCAAAPRGVYRIQGTERMNQRPMKGLIDALRALGAEIRCTGVEGFFPIEIHARGLRGGPVSIDATESSQMLSALLMVAPLCSEAMEVTAVGGVRQPFVLMTKFLMTEFGVGVGSLPDGNTLTVLPVGRYPFEQNTYPVEPDATAATYFEALVAITSGSLYIPGLKGVGLGLQGDTRFLNIMKLVGMNVTTRYMAGLPSGMRLSEGTDLTFPKGQSLAGIGTQDFSEFSDTFLTLAAISPLLSGPTRITGIAHTRKQETDRVAGMANELRRLGQDVVETEDSLTITPRPLKPGQVIQTYHDHRFAMSFGILGSFDLHGDGKPWLTIDNPGCCAKTFPNFFDVLSDLRTRA